MHNTQNQPITRPFRRTLRLSFVSYATPKIHPDNAQTIILLKKASMWAFFVDFDIVSGDNMLSEQAFRVIFNISKEFLLCQHAGESRAMPCSTL